MTRRTRALLVAAVWSAACSANAENGAAPQVYRCGPDGRSFQSAPCADGVPMTLRVDRPDEDARQEAEAAHRRIAEAADDMADDRQARERALRPTGPAGFRASPLPEWQTAPHNIKPTAKPQHRHGSKARRHQDPNSFTALDPTTIKARRAHRAQH